MLIPLLLLVHAQAAGQQRPAPSVPQRPRNGSAEAPAPAPPGQEYDGFANATKVKTPRLAGGVTIDGNLTEPQWAAAAVLRGFSQFQPLDSRRAADSTRVLVWYSDDAMYFGIRAYAAPGTVRGTLADRDKISNDDHVMLVLDTYNDNRRAFVFAVNPLGVQADGQRSEGGSRGRQPGAPPGGGGASGAGPGASKLGINNVDLNQDMVWDSKGHETEFGYEVEVRIPFNAVRYIPGEDTWGLNVVRVIQATNYQDTWAPMRRSVSSILIQSGRLEDLRDMKRGLVLDIAPVATSLTSGSPQLIPGTTTSVYSYDTKPEFGGDVRWSLTPSFTLNGTVRPDFSQVEADAGQLPGDVRFSLFFPELRPFFLEGSESFDAPNQLVYTRNIVRPVGAAKLTGKVASTDVALLSAVDDKAYSATKRDDPLYNVLRLRRDVGQQSTLGFLLTDREEGASFNRIAAVDGRFALTRSINGSFQVGGSSTGNATSSSFGRLFNLTSDKSGRAYGYFYSLRALSPEFTTRTGFINRTNIVDANMIQRYNLYGAPGSAVQQVIMFVSAGSVWSYEEFFKQRSPLETRLGFSTTASIRGGWTLNLTPTLVSSRFDPASYATRYTVRTSGATTDTARFTPGPRVSSFQWQARIQTPQYAKFGATVSATYGDDTEFLETTNAQRLDLNATIDFRVTPQIRVATSMLHQEFVRKRDGSTLLVTNIPRLRLEYQATRAFLFRFVTQYDSRYTDALRDPATNLPVLFKSASGAWSASKVSKSNGIRADWLVAFLPTPGRVVYVGYGASLTQTDPFSFTDRPERTSDGLFVKVSYQFRLR